MVGLSRKRVFPKRKGDSITGQDRAQKHCDFRFSQIGKKSKVAVLQLGIKVVFEIFVAFIDSCTNLLSKRPPDMIFDMPSSRGSILLPCSLASGDLSPCTRGGGGS